MRNLQFYLSAKGPIVAVLRHQIKDCQINNSSWVCTQYLMVDLTRVSNISWYGIEEKNFKYLTYSEMILVFSSNWRILNTHDLKKSNFSWHCSDGSFKQKI